MATQAELETAIVKDATDLARAVDNVFRLERGESIENLTLDNARNALQALSRCILNKQASLDALQAPAAATAQEAAFEWPALPEKLDRNTVIKLIKDALKKRSGKSWSVTGGRGTAWGWLTIDTPPADRCFDRDGVKRSESEYGYSSLEARTELAKLLGLDRPVHQQGHSIASSNDHYREYIERARGQVPTKIAEPYWD